MNKSKTIKIISIIFLILVLFSVITVLKNSTLLQKIINKINNEDEQLFSYVIYDNKDTSNIKTLITVNSADGIEYIEYPDGKKIETNCKTKVAIDYVADENQEQVFKIKEKGKDEVQEILSTSNDFINDTTVASNASVDVSGYKVVNVENNIGLDNYDNTYYKIGENGEWIKDTKFSLVDYDLVQNNLINEDNTVTIYSKIVNTMTNCEVISSKNFAVNTTVKNENNIQADSLLAFMQDSNIETGKYNVTVSDETYAVKVYTINENMQISADVSFGTEEDVGTANEYAQNMVALKVNGDLTIDEGTILTSYASKNGYGGTKGMLIYCTGTITNNGTISMTARGAYAEGQNIYIYKNKDGSYEYVPAEGASGGTSVKNMKNGISGNAGLNRQTGRRRIWGFRNRFCVKWSRNSRNIVFWRN